MTFFGDIALPIVLILIMIGIGLSTKLEDFRALIKFPKATILGVISQIILLPAIALLIGVICNYDQELILGLLLLSLCPSGTGSNIITKMVKGNLALSVSLTTISNLKSLLTIPLFISLYIKNGTGSISAIKLPYYELSFRVFILAIIPTIMGIVIAKRSPKFVQASKATLKWLLPALLFGVFTAIMFFDDKKNADVNIFELLIPAILINVISFFIPFFFAKLFKCNIKETITIAIEGGLKNSAIGLLIATTYLNIPAAELLILAYSFISFYLTFILAFILMKLKSSN